VQDRLPEVERLVIQKGQLLRRRAGLAEIAAIVAHRMLEDAAANAQRDLFRRLFVLQLRTSFPGEDRGTNDYFIHLTCAFDN